ncbi:hypothetical protein GCM10010840_27610 [Deinococcus aerolatus]|uniref:DUF4352 domain-containing protein n=1 Tax=Deinococcus aerolatus TaxID=522487 RepID=A0ABQ2GD16_9DEIO|nr:DUF4352 domain-containing protein [Deinococcus aerolatus]GGL88049.1 hypothetical protein GCM10010840_27610 [Deinococcus aerolatus]
MKTIQRAVGLNAALILSTMLSPTGAANPAPKPATPVVQGTTQLAGGQGTLGKTVTLGKGRAAINFTLNSAEFTLARVTVGTNVYVPKADEKLLILRYTLQNPQKESKDVSWNTLKFTAVDAQDTNHEHDNYVGRDGTSEQLDMTLKPAQKINVYAVMAVPAAGPIPKLIVSAGDEFPVQRYDLRGKVKGLAAALADPKDPSFATAREVQTVANSTYAPLGKFDMKLDAAALSPAAINGQTPPSGQRYLVATLGLRNGTAKTAEAAEWTFNTFKFQLRNADGEVQVYDDYLLKVARDETANGTLKPGEEARFRVYFLLPDNVAGSTLSVSEGESRTIAFSVSAAR